MTIIRLEDAEGKIHEWEWEWMPYLAEARIIKAHTRMSTRQFLDGLVEGDADAITALLLILFRRSGRSIPYEEIDCDLNKLVFIDPDPDPAPEAGEGAEAAQPAGKDDPTSSTEPGATPPED